MPEKPKKSGKGLKFQDQVLAEAAKQGVETTPNEPEEQQSLPGIDPPPPTPVVQGDLMLAQFVLPHFAYEDGVRNVGFEFSFTLSKEHEGKLPKPVEDAWKHVKKRNSKGVVGLDLSDQTIAIWLVPDGDPDPDMILSNSKIELAQVRMAKKPGTTEKIPKFTFRAVVEATNSAYTFAAEQYGNSLWIQIHQSQGTLEV